VLLHTSVYAGVPAANRAFAIAAEVLGEERRGDRGSRSGRNFVQSLSRGLAVIRALNSPEAMTLSDVARASNLTRASARRFVLTLEELGYVQQSGGRFALTPRVLELGFAYLSALGLRRSSRRIWSGWSRRCESPRRSRSWTASRSSTSPVCRRDGS